jgi:hypothetical protein
MVSCRCVGRHLPTGRLDAVAEKVGDPGAVERLTMASRLGAVGRSTAVAHYGRYGLSIIP